MWRLFTPTSGKYCAKTSSTSFKTTFVFQVSLAPVNIYFLFALAVGSLCAFLLPSVVWSCAEPFGQSHLFSVSFACSGPVGAPSWAGLGPLGAVLGLHWGPLGSFGASSSRLRPSWGCLGGVSRASCGAIEGLLGILWGFRSQERPRESPNMQLREWVGRRGGGHGVFSLGRESLGLLSCQHAPTGLVDLERLAA